MESKRNYYWLETKANNAYDNKAAAPNANAQKIIILMWWNNNITLHCWHIHGHSPLHDNNPNVEKKEWLQKCEQLYRVGAVRVYVEAGVGLKFMQFICQRFGGEEAWGVVNPPTAFVHLPEKVQDEREPQRTSPNCDLIGIQ